MEKIYMEVFVPGINKSYDMIVSPELKIKDAAQYIFKTVAEFEMLDIENGSPVLCDAKLKRIYDGDLLLVQCDIRDGSKLILV